MTSEKSRVLESILGGTRERIVPQSCAPGVRLTLANGRVTLLDEVGGATYKSALALASYAAHDDDKIHGKDIAE